MLVINGGDFPRSALGWSKSDHFVQCWMSSQMGIFPQELCLAEALQAAMPGECDFISPCNKPQQDKQKSATKCMSISEIH